MNKEYYVWDTQIMAQSALDFINNSGWFPIVGRNAKTGELQPDKQMTTLWQLSAEERLDTKWTVERIPNSRLDDAGVPEEERIYFMTKFAPVIEVCEDSCAWFPVPSEDIENNIENLQHVGD